MCIEIHTRYRRCTHTRLLHWTYCPILTPSERQPSTGRSCRKHKLRYKESKDATSCFECKISEIAGWSIVRSPTFSNLQERSPTVSSLGYGSPSFSTFRPSPTLSTFASSAGLLGIGAGNRESKESKDSEVSVAVSGEPLALKIGGWRASGDSKEIPEKEPGQDVKEGGVKGWFKKRFKAREEYKNEAFGFQRMDA
ncbi:hypothetical protein G6011_04819 [Alternaria panax]|uniref:Uncharacterized protein n=1 Tax=Alternaria panax TaxID=48097 RepID=A0AAD4NUJ2_9PLEO|nr:hypothetical protein G6011_04819 [Alternaria panax]